MAVLLDNYAIVDKSTQRDTTFYAEPIDGALLDFCKAVHLFTGVN